MTAADQTENEKWTWRLWRSDRIRSLIPYAAFVVLLIITIITLGEEIEHHISLIEVLRRLGKAGMLEEGY